MTVIGYEKRLMAEDLTMPAVYCVNTLRTSRVTKKTKKASGDKN
jgi:hypothetical protein